MAPSRVDVLWRCDPLCSAEYFRLVRTDNGWGLAGDVSLLVDGVPGHVGYRVGVSGDWVTRSAAIEFTIGGRHRQIEIQHAAGEWAVDGIVRRDLAGCTDLDLGWTPATNTIPLRRHALGIGEHVEIRAAWVRFPELDVQATDQRYVRIARDRWRYQAGPYDFVLVLSEEGLVMQYGDDLWRAEAVVRSGG